MKPNTAIKIFNSLTGKNGRLVLKPNKQVSLYVCGPTVYDQMHIGHARTYIVFDVLVRFLRSQGVKVKYIQNITDIDDKIIDRARLQKISPAALASAQTKLYLSASKKLGLNSVDKYIKASSVLSVIKETISRLIKLNYAYETSSGIYFRVKKYSRYGQLSKQNINELRSGYRVEPDPVKEDPLDFALWKKQKEKSEKSWPSPWGPGRPGWHIECSSIIAREMSLPIDIHGGGDDLKFPHHEAEIAQTALASRSNLARFWMHTGLLLVDGAKMSKSLGNFVTVPDLLNHYDPRVIRLGLLFSHYRSPLNFSFSILDQSIESLLSIKTALTRLDSVSNLKSPSDLSKSSFLLKKISSHSHKFISSLNSDLNTPEALSHIFALVSLALSDKINSPQIASSLRSILEEYLAILGINLPREPIPARIKKLVSSREVFRTVRDFKQADLIRDQINTAGFRLADTPVGAIIVKNTFMVSNRK